MADYFTMFRVDIELDLEAIDWALRLNRYLMDMYHGKDTTPCTPDIKDAARQLGEDYYPRCTISPDDNSRLVIRDMDGDADLDATVAFIQVVLKRFGLNKYVVLHAIHTCSRPVMDAYGSSLCVITRKTVAWLNDIDWIANKKAELLRELEQEAENDKKSERT